MKSSVVVTVILTDVFYTSFGFFIRIKKVDLIISKIEKLNLTYSHRKQIRVYKFQNSVGTGYINVGKIKKK